MENVHTAERLKELQALPLERKITITQNRIFEWHSRNNGQVYVSVSGGKDSTVLLDVARKILPDIPGVFVNTGLEYPEIQEFARSLGNVATIYPKMSFTEVLSQYGYPLISKETAEAMHYARRIKPDGTKCKNDSPWANWRRKSFTEGESFGKDSRFNKNRWGGVCNRTPCNDFALLLFHHEKIPVY